MHKTCLDTYVKTMGKSSGFSSVSIGKSTVNHANGITTFRVSYEVKISNFSQIYEGYAQFPRLIVNSRIWELWLVCIYLHALNLQPITESKILPPNGMSELSIRFCEDLYSHNYQIWHNIFDRTSSLNDFIINYEELLVSNYNIDNIDRVAVAMSGGKESIVSYHTMKSLGYKTFGIFVDYVGRIKRREGQRLYNHLNSNHRNVFRISSDLIDLLCLVPLEFGKHSMYLSPIICLIAMLAYSRGLGAIIIGNEYDNTSPIVQHEVLYFGDNYEQSTVFERKFSKFLNDINIPIVLFSPLYNLSETCIQYLASKTPYSGFQESCTSPIQSGSMDYRSCGICLKCKRIAAMMTCLGIENSNFDSSIFNMDPNSIVNSQSGLREIETILYLLNKLGYRIESKIKSTYHPEVFDFILDSWHPLLSERIRDYIISEIRPKHLNTDT